jgi:peroxiredoxin
MAALEPGARAPSFELTDLDGNQRSLERIGRDDLLLVVFYHRACPTCQFAMPFVGAMARAIKSPQVQIWGVSQDDEDESAAFAQDKGLAMPILIDSPPFRVSDAYGLTNVPTLFLVDGSGRVVKNCVGFSKADFLEIAAALAKHAGTKMPGIFAGRDDVPAMKPG